MIAAAIYASNVGRASTHDMAKFKQLMLQNYSGDKFCNNGQMTLSKAKH